MIKHTHIKKKYENHLPFLFRFHFEDNLIKKLTFILFKKRDGSYYK